MISSGMTATRPETTKHTKTREHTKADIPLCASQTSCAWWLSLDSVSSRENWRKTLASRQTGIACVFAYMGAFAIAVPDAGILEERSGVVIFALVSLFFGLVVGHSWFRDPDVM